MTYAVIDSPVGLLTLVSSSDDELAGLYMEQHRHRPDLETFGARDDSVLPAVAEQLRQYFEAGRTTFDVPLRMNGTPFQRQVWNALKDIPYGETTTYGELAALLGMPPGASRAVGLANGKNPISIIVPCHRVIGSTGSLTGYGGGLERKQRLLDHERADVLF
ncbi:MAG TPA: methylated-DNA--[protein]-cysteine S-methyltransferase [Kribbella sp.]